MKKLVILTFLLLATVVSQAQFVDTIAISDVSRAKLITEHDGLKISWWQTCTGTVCTTQTATVTQDFPPTVAGNRVYSLPFPQNATVGTKVYGVRVCNDAGCSPQGTKTVIVTDTAPNPPLSPKIFIAPVTPPPVVMRDDEHINGFRLVSTSPYAKTGTDGKDMGADVVALMKSMCGVRKGQPCTAEELAAIQ